MLISFGVAVPHKSMAFGQRGWNGQPGGGFSGSGISPFNTMRAPRRAGSDWGTAEIRASV
jgi:hypothetical protein